jgi:hypothetical protein
MSASIAPAAPWSWGIGLVISNHFDIQDFLITVCGLLAAGQRSQSVALLLTESSDLMSY